MKTKLVNLGLVDKYVKIFSLNFVDVNINFGHNFPLGMLLNFEF